MLKNIDKYETSAHFSQREYRRNSKKKSANKDVLIFSSVFFIGVLILLGFAKVLSPNVDVAIGGPHNDVAYLQDDESMNSSIDTRLQSLKIEDESKKSESEEIFSPELDEKVVLPQQNKKTVGQMTAEQIATAETSQTETTQKDVKQVAEKTVQTTTTTAAPKPKVTEQTQVISAKVVVGYYATEKQAEVAKSIMQDAGLSVTPIIKNLGGYYTLQVGSYSTKERAQQAANDLLKSNFPARVITE